MTWKRGQYTIALNPRRGNIDDPGVRTGHTSGPFGIQSKTWHITHLPSGKRLADSANTFAEAKAIVSRLLPLADWAKTDPFHSFNETQRLAVRNAIYVQPLNVTQSEAAWAADYASDDPSEVQAETERLNSGNWPDDTIDIREVQS